jgi:hypothetical protein
MQSTSTSTAPSTIPSTAPSTTPSTIPSTAPSTTPSTAPSTGAATPYSSYSSDSSYGSYGSYGESSKLNIDINGKKYPSVILNKGIYPVEDIMIEQSNLFTNKNINENIWNNQFKKQFTQQYNFFKEYFPSLKKWDSENIFSDINIKPDKFNNYYEQTIIKDVSSELKMKATEDGKYNIFSVSLFTSKDPKYIDRIISINNKILKGGYSYDDYINKYSNWVKQSENQKELGFVKPGAPWYKDILTYLEILISNIKLHQEKYPNWIIRLYTDDTIINSSDSKIKDIYKNLLTKDIQIYKTIYKKPLEGKIATMLSRFLPMFDPEIKRFLSIEADNWPTNIYWKILDQWINNKNYALSYISGYTYGWPSGIKLDDPIKINDKETAELIHFRQNYGGMFGLLKPNDKIYNPKLLDYLIDFSIERKNIFNKLFINNKFILKDKGDSFDTNYNGVLDQQISDDSILDKGIDEVWLSLFILPKIPNVFAVPIFGDNLNFSLLEKDDKIKILNKFGMKEDLADLDDSAFKSIAFWSNKKNKTIFYSLEIILVENLLGIRNDKLDFNINKYINKFTLSFNNVYPDFQAANNYNELSNVKTLLQDNNNDVYTGSFIIQKQKYLKYKMKYIKLKELEKQINNTN